MNKLKEWIDNKTLRCLVALFLIVSFIRCVLAILYSDMVIFYDEWIYWGFSKSFAEYGLPMLRGHLSGFAGIIYPMLISVAHLITNSGKNAYYLVLCMNTLCICSACFPSYCLGKKLGLSQRSSLTLGAVVMLMPEMIYGTLIQQENIHFPLFLWMIYFFYSSVIHKDKTPKSVLVLLGMGTYLLEVVKNLSLALMLAMLLYFAVEMFLEKNMWKTHLRNAVLLAIGNVLGRVVWNGGMAAYYSLKGNTPPPYVIGYDSVIKSLFDWNTIFGIFDSTFMYVLLIILATGVFTIFAVGVHWKSYEKSGRRLLVLLTCMFLGLLGTVCVTILSRERLTYEVLRFYYRYFYFLFVPLLALWFWDWEKNKLFHKKWFLGAGILFVLLVAGVFRLPAAVGSPDGTSLSWLEWFIKNDQLTLLKILLVVVTAIVLVIFYKFGKNTGYKVVFGIMMGMMLFNNGLEYVQLAERHTREDICLYEEAEVINEKIAAENAESVLLVAEGKVSAMKLEIWFDFDYNMCLEEEFESYLWTGGAGELNEQIINTTEPATEYYPNYILSEKEYDIMGYERVDWEIEELYLYEKQEEKIGFGDMVEIIDIWPDAWIGEGTDVVIGSTRDEKMTTICLEMDTLSPEPVEVTVMDALGNETELRVENEEKKIFEVEIERESITMPYLLRIETDKTFTVPTDERSLSVRIYNIDVEGME